MVHLLSATDSFLMNVQTTSSLILMLPWGSERSPSSDFNFRKKNKSAQAIFGEQEGRQVVLTPLPPLKVSD
jgi:hypothetical protein